MIKAWVVTIVVLFVLFFLTGCATAPIASVPQIVKVPVPVFCKITPIPKPSFPFDETATASMTLYQKTQLLLAQDQILKAYETKLQGAIDGCAAPPDSASAPIAVSAPTGTN